MGPGSGDAPDQEGQAVVIRDTDAGPRSAKSIFDVDKDSGMIHSVVTTAANVWQLTPAVERCFGWRCDRASAQPCLKKPDGRLQDQHKIGLPFGLI